MTVPGSRTIKVGDVIKIGIKWEVDTYPDLEYLGIFSWDLPKGVHYIDCKEGFLYGPDSVAIKAVTPVNPRLIEELGIRYWVPGENHLPLGAGWDHVADTVKQEVIATWGSLREASIGYIKQDYLRHWTFVDGDIDQLGCNVDVSVNGYELGGDSLWGLESDSGKYLEEVEEECIAEALRDAVATLTKLHKNAPAYLKELSELIEKGVKNNGLES